MFVNRKREIGDKKREIGVPLSEVGKPISMVFKQDEPKILEVEQPVLVFGDENSESSMEEIN